MPGVTVDGHDFFAVHAATAEALGVTHAKKAELAHLAQDLAWNEALLFPELAMRLDLLVNEAAQAVTNHLVLGAEGKHRGRC